MGTNKSKMKTIHKHKLIHTVVCGTKVHVNKTKISSFWEQVTCKKCLEIKESGHSV